MGAHSQISTDTVRVLSDPTRRWTMWAKGNRVKDSHLQPSRSERDASAVGLTRHELVHPAGWASQGLQIGYTKQDRSLPRTVVPPANSPFEAEDDHNFTTDAEMVGGLGFAPSSRRLRAGTSLSKFATRIQMNGAAAGSSTRTICWEDSPAPVQHHRRREG